MSDKRYLEQRRQTWYFNMRVPADLIDQVGKKKVLYSLQTRDLSVAQRLRWTEKEKWEKAFDLMRTTSESDQTKIYEDTKALADPAIIADDDMFEVLTSDLIDEGYKKAGVRWQDHLDPQDRPDMPPEIEAQIHAYMDLRAAHEGRKEQHKRRYEPSFEQTARNWLADRAKASSAKLNQHEATIRFMSSLMGTKSIRKITPEIAAEFVDGLKELNPAYKSDPKTKEYSFRELIRKHGGHEQGLAGSTINRHINRLVELWGWAKSRGLCVGDDPFAPLRVKTGRSSKDKRGGYVNWSNDELKAIVQHPKLRQDLRECIYVALYTGMRINEVCSLKWCDLRQDEETGIWFLDVTDSKTEAGIRQVPLHAHLSWLKDRKRGQDTQRIWTEFNLEGPELNKPGEDASKMFGDFKKRRLGVTTRWKAFHSFRGNFTTQLENAGVYYTTIQDIIGHKRDSLAMDTYSAGLYLKNKKEAVDKVDFSFLNMTIIP